MRNKMVIANVTYNCYFKIHFSPWFSHTYIQCRYIHVYMYMYVHTRVFDKSIGPKSLALHSSHFWPDGTVNYDYIVTNSISSSTVCMLY